jgi:signal transduction histidine kinase
MARRKRLLLIERASYCLLLLPWLTDFIELGRPPSSPRELLTELVVSCLIAAFILVLRGARKGMEELENFRKSLILVTTHDLKNPLTAIVASIGCIRSGMADPEMTGKLLDLTLQGCRRLVRLIDMLLDIDRLESAGLKPRLAPLALGRLIDSVVEEALPQASAAGVSIASRVQEGLPDLMADEDLLRRVAANLLQNALKYTLKGGAVTVSASRDGGGFLLEVADTGIGISPEHLGRVFDKYYRAEGTDQGTRKGSGLGLYFCKLAVDAHGGSISMRGEPGRGAAVSIRLP